MKITKIKTCSILLSALLAGSTLFAFSPVANLSAAAAIAHTYENVTSLSRVELAKKLYDLAGKPAHSGKEKFIDVTSKTNGYDAIVWANDQKLVTGENTYLYSASYKVSLTNVVTAFYTLAGSPKTSGDLSGFSDHSSPTKHDNALIWATQNRIIQTNGIRLNDNRAVSTVEYEEIENAYLAYIQMKFDNYICLGDSVAAGYHNGLGNCTFDPSLNPKAYHTLLSNAIGAPLTSLAGHGMRVDELRSILDMSYECDAYHIDTSAHMLANYPLNYLHEKFTNGIKNDGNEKDLITIQLGMNELAIGPIYRTAEEKTFPAISGVTNAISEGDYLKASVEFAKVLPDLVDYINTFLSYSNYYYNNRLVNCWAATIQTIRELNPNATIVVLGGYTSMEDCTGLLGKLVYYILDPWVSALNTFYRQQASTLGYVFADIGCPESYAQRALNGDGESAYDGHLTDKGNQQVTDSILSFLPISVRN